MGIFDDKQYDEMDWLAKAIEPTIAGINDTLSKLPDETTFSPAQILRIAINSYNVGVDINTLVLMTARNAGVQLSNYDDDFKKIAECFSMTLDKPIILDLEKMTAEGGMVTLTKHKAMFEEKELEAMMGTKGVHMLRTLNFEKVEIARANEIGELLGNDLIRQKRSSRQKCHVIAETLHRYFHTNEWNIKNIELADKVCLWMKVYLEEGNLAALTNFCKFKVMTHSGNPIYSMEEEAL